MSFSRCVVVKVSEYVWERILPYMIKRGGEYWWIATTKNELYKPNSSITHKHVTLHIWWDGCESFSSTPLRSRIKRVRQRVIKNNTLAADIKECSLAFKLLRSRQTKDFLRELVISIKEQTMGYCNVIEELKTYLTTLMQNAHYTPAYIATIIQKVKPIKKSQPTLEVSSLQNESNQPSTSQPEEKSETPITRGAKKILGMQLLKLMGRVSHGVKDMSEDIRSLAQDVGGVNIKLDTILAIYSNPLESKLGSTLF